MNCPILTLSTQVLLWKEISLLSVFYRVFRAAKVLSFKPADALSFLLRQQSVKIIGLPEWWQVHREEEEAWLWSVLSGEVEQPLAQQCVMLFQVLYQVSLLLHHLLQAGALSMANKSTCRISDVAE